MMRLIVAMIFFCSNSSFAIDTSIRVLGIYHQGASITSQYMRDQLTGISSAWNDTGLSGSSGITVELLNGANAVAAVIPGMPTNGNTAILNWATSQAGIIALRNAWSADVVVVFSPYMDSQSCGATGTYFVNGNFNPDGQGMDLTYATDAYVSVVSVGCDLTTGAHEFGHLFGAGHRTNGPNNPPERLYPDSRAFSAWVYNASFGLNFDISTVMGHPVECPSMGGPYCIFVYQYSKNGALGDGAHQNARTMNMVAKSIANYISEPTPPAPALFPPINVHGYLIDACVEYGWTRHQLHWNDDPRTNVPVNSYQIWYSQPPGQPYSFGWSVPYIQKFSDVYVIGANSDIRVNACTTTQCSALSSTSYLAQWTCGNW